MAATLTQRGIQIQGPGEAKLVSDLPIPKLRDDHILVKVVAVALNPTDYALIRLANEKGPVSGCDYAGVVEEVGAAVTNGLKAGDRVAGWTHGANEYNHESGAFAEHIIAKGNLQIKIPDQISFEEAATLGVGITTVGQGLYQSLGFPLPTEPAKDHPPVLIYGGSTATGTLAIQFAKLSGLQVIVTCSPHNFDLVKSLGADSVFDYRSPTCVSDIQAASNNNIRHVFDCISTPVTAQISADCFGPNGGKYSALHPISDFPRSDVSTVFTSAYTIFGEKFRYGPNESPAKPEDYQFGVKFWALTQGLLASGKIKPHPYRVWPGGLEGILEGLKALEEENVSGFKIVYRIAD